MKRMLTALTVAALSVMTLIAGADETKAKKKLPSQMKSFTMLAAAKKEAAKYEAPIFVAVVVKGSPEEACLKKMMSNKFFKELASKGFFVYTMRVEQSKKEKEADARTFKILYEKLTQEDQDLLNVIAPPDIVMVRHLPLFGLVNHECTEAIIKVVDVPKFTGLTPETTYYGPYLQALQSAAQAYGVDIEMSKEMRKYIENPPAEKKDKKGRRRR